MTKIIPKNKKCKKAKWLSEESLHIAEKKKGSERQGGNWKIKHWYNILTHICGILRDSNNNPICKTEKETQMYRTNFWILWDKARVGCPERIALNQIYYQGWNRSSAQVGCMRQVPRTGALGRPRGMGWGGRWEGFQDGLHMYTHGWFMSKAKITTIL